MRFKDDETTAAIEVPAGAVAATATKTVEQWATAKGYLPEFFVPPDRRLPGGVAGPMGTVSMNFAGHVGPKHNPKYGFFSAARVVNHWPEGKEMTEADFDAAIKAAGEHLAR